MREGQQRIAFTVPIFEPRPSQYYIRVVSDQVGGGWGWGWEGGLEREMYYTDFQPAAA